MLTPAELLTRLGTRLPVLTMAARPATAATDAARDDRVELRPARQGRPARPGPVGRLRGGWTLSAAETVCDITLEIWAPSWITAWCSGWSARPVRYDMLETIREHASEELNVQDSADELRRRHAAHFLAIAESANLFFEAEGPQRHEVVTTEQANIREALAWADNAGELELALNLAIALENFWATSATSEGVRWFDTLLERAVNVAPLLHARALRCHAAVLTMSGATGAGRVRTSRAWRSSVRSRRAGIATCSTGWPI